MICKFEDLGKSNLIPGCIYEGGDSKIPLKDDPLIKLFKVDGYKKGIGNIGGFRKASKEKNGKIINENIAFVVMVDSGKQEEWPNEMDENTGIFKYYGDNRTPGNDIFKTKKLGNKFLYEIFKKAYMNSEERAKIPPIFVFKSTGKGCNKKFIGLAVPGVRGKNIQEVLERQTFKSNEGEFENFVANFTILDISNGVIKREWLEDLKDNNKIISYNEPQEWSNFILNGLNGMIYGPNYGEIEIKEEEYINYNNQTERKIKVRITQGAFRKKLLERDKKCVICGLDIQTLLIASHIKPWSDADDYEKQDSNNGLLLCANHDALFDKGYISFDYNGKIKISNLIDKSYYEKLNVDKNIKIKLNEKQNKYMEYHRKNILQNEEIIE